MGPCIISLVPVPSAFASIVYRSDLIHDGPPVIGESSRAPSPRGAMRYAALTSPSKNWQFQLALPGEIVTPPPLAKSPKSFTHGLTDTTSHFGLSAGRAGF